MNTKHTPGPWQQCLGQVTFEVFTEERNICQINDCGSVDGEDEANARLIAVSPDLLAELETMVKFCQELRNSRQEYPANLEAATALISKAKGQ